MDITSEKEILGNDDNNLEPKVEIEEIEIKTIGSDNSDNIHTSDVRSITSKNFYEEPLKFNTENTNTIELLAYNYNDNRTKDVVSPTQKSSCIPHNGKLVKNIICSPNLKYIATFSEDDNSIVGWLHLENNGTLEPETFYDGSQRNGFIACIETLSDEKYIVFESNQSQSNFANEYYPNEEVITCKAAYNISLPKLTASDNVAKYFIISNSYLLINNGDTMASQWDLTKMEFEFQYFSEILLPNNYYRYNSNAAIFNKDKSLLAVYLYVEKQLIIYSIQYGIKLTTFTFGKSKCDDMAFIYTKDNTEHLFVVLQNEYADIANNYILMDPYNLDNYTDISEIYREYLFKDNLLIKKHLQKIANDKIIKILDNNSIFIEKLIPEEMKFPNSHLKNFNHLFSSSIIMESTCERDLSKQYEEIKNEFKNLQVNHAELKNQFDELKKELIKQFDINSKFMTYQLKEAFGIMVDESTDIPTSDKTFGYYGKMRTRFLQLLELCTYYFINN
ncbi:16589_t:CDS:2 [Entrophospora sp. SA101]|nr:16589_t:CDS:2 [Entrophospora sp. SA101]